MARVPAPLKPLKAHFLARMKTKLCAPGFKVTLGVSILFFFIHSVNAIEAKPRTEEQIQTNTFLTVSLIDRLYELVDEVDPGPLEQPISVGRTKKRSQLYAIAEDVAFKLNKNGALSALSDPGTDDATVDRHLQVIRPIFRSRCIKALLCSR